MPRDLEFFCEQHPELVGEVETLSRAKEYSPSELASRVQGHQTFVLSSTFMYKDQLESMLEAFDKGLFGQGPFTFYIELLRINLEEWTEREEDEDDYSYRARMNFSNHDEFIERLIRMVQEERLVLYDVVVHHHVIDSHTKEKVFWKDYDDHPYREMAPYDTEAIRMVYNDTTKQFERTQLDADERYIQDAPRLRDPNE